MKVFKYGWQYLTRHKLYLTTFVILNLIISFISILMPFITGKYIDFLVLKKDIKTIYYFSFIILIIGLSNIIISYISNIILVKLQTMSAFDLNYTLLKYVKKLPLLYFTNVDPVYLNQRLNSDSNTLINFVLNSFISIIVKIITSIFTIFMLWRISKKLSIMLFCLIPIYLGVYFIFRKPLFKFGYNFKEMQNKFFARMNEQLSNLRFIKVNSIFELLNKELKTSFKYLMKSLLKYTKISYIFLGFDSTINTIANILLVFFGGIEFYNGKISIGDFTIMRSYFSLLLGCTSYFLNLGKSYQDSLVSYERIQQITNVHKENNGEKLISSLSSIELKNISFGYNDVNIINNFNYKFTKGNIYCISGKNGTGKSTLINIIIGLYNDSYTGNVLYNGLDIQQLDLYSLRKTLLGVTEQESNLMNHSIMENVTYGLDVFDKEKIEYWCKRLNIYHLVKSESHKLDLEYNGMTSNVSGGEKQKIFLTRILIKDPNVIILDEPTNGLDINSIYEFKNILKEIKKDKIIILISHDNEILDISDNVIKLDII